MQDKRLYGIRGAVCTENTAEDMQKAVADLMGRIFEKNALCEDDIVSVRIVAGWSDDKILRLTDNK